MSSNPSYEGNFSICHVSSQNLRVKLRVNQSPDSNQSDGCQQKNHFHEHSHNFLYFCKPNAWIVFDFKFNKILTAKVLRILYAIFAVVITLVAIGSVIAGIGSNSVAVIILGPLICIIYLMFLRIVFESVIIKFQMAQDIREIKIKYVGSLPPPPSN